MEGTSVTAVVQGMRFGVLVLKGVVRQFGCIMFGGVVRWSIAIAVQLHSRLFRRAVWTLRLFDPKSTHQSAACRIARTAKAMWSGCAVVVVHDAGGMCRVAGALVLWGVVLGGHMIDAYTAEGPARIGWGPNASVSVYVGSRWRRFGDPAGVRRVLHVWGVS